MSNYFKYFIFILAFFYSVLSISQKKNENKNDGKKIYGEASVVSNYVEKGISQSDKSWAIQSGFGYKMGPQARIGLWGSSVKLPSNDESVNLRPYFDVRIDFTANSFSTLKYELNRYFSSGTRNGSIFSLDINIFNYRVLFDTNDNWEGTTSSSSSFGFKKEFVIPWGVLFTPGLNYTQVQAEGYSNYFDTRLSLGYKMADAIVELVHTYNSSSSQFNGRGDMAVLLVLGVRF